MGTRWHPRFILNIQKTPGNASQVGVLARAVRAAGVWAPLAASEYTLSKRGGGGAVRAGRGGGGVILGGGVGQPLNTLYRTRKCRAGENGGGGEF